MQLAPSRSLRLLPILAASAALLVGCDTAPAQPVAAESASDAGQAAFEPVAVPEKGTLSDDPRSLAQNLFGGTGPVEENYSEEAVTLSATPERQVVLFTQTGLEDDSLRGKRYRLEFVPHGTKWKLSSAGRQVTCWPGRGHEDWSAAPCK